MRQKNNILLILLLFFISFSMHAQIVILYKCGEPAFESSMIKPGINIVNNSDFGLELKNIKIRYFYSKDGQSDEQYQIEYAVVGGSYIKVTFKYGFMEITFPDVNMVIPPGGGETGIIQIKVHKQDWSNYNQSDDFSFNPTFSEYREFGKIALYYMDALVWGTEHMPSPTPRMAQN